jgi:hypothetical protein
MSQENFPGTSGTLVTSPDLVEHLAVDRARPRAGDRFAYGGDEDTVRTVSEESVLAASPDPDPRMHDQVVAPNTRLSRIPIWQTIRKGFEWDREANLGKRAELISPLAGPDNLQSMEESPTYIRQTIRVTPGPWDRELVIGGNE